MYVSGDNASVEVVRTIAERVGQVDTAVIFTGAVRTPLFDGAALVVGAHTGSWGHSTEDRGRFEAAFAAAGPGDRSKRELTLLCSGAGRADQPVRPHASHEAADRGDSRPAIARSASAPTSSPARSPVP